MYLMDSILKNIGGIYLEIFSDHIVDVFIRTFRASTSEIQRKLLDLLKTWKKFSLFKKEQLQDIDEKVLSIQADIARKQKEWVNTRQPSDRMRQNNETTLRNDQKGHENKQGHDLSGHRINQKQQHTGINMNTTGGMINPMNQNVHGQTQHGGVNTTGGVINPMNPNVTNPISHNTPNVPSTSTNMQYPYPMAHYPTGPMVCKM